MLGSNRSPQGMSENEVPPGFASLTPLAKLDEGNSLFDPPGQAEVANNPRGESNPDLLGYDPPP